MNPIPHNPRDYVYITDKIHQVFDKQPRTETSSFEQEHITLTRYEDLDKDGKNDVKYTAFINHKYYGAFLQIDKLIYENGVEKVAGGYRIQTDELRDRGEKLERFSNWEDKLLAEIFYRGNLTRNNMFDISNAEPYYDDSTRFKYWKEILMDPNFGQPKK